MLFLDPLKAILESTIHYPITFKLSHKIFLASPRSRICHAPTDLYDKKALWQENLWNLYTIVKYHFSQGLFLQALISIL